MLLFATCLGACAQSGNEPSPAAPASGSPVLSVDPEDAALLNGFDAQAWLADARDVSVETETADLDDARVDRARRLSVALNDAADWQRACDTYFDYETGEEIYEPVPLEGAIWVRGLIEIADLSETSAVVAVTCNFGAYQGSYALVHISGSEVEVIFAPELDEGGQPSERQTGVFSTPNFDNLSEGFFETVGLARGLGDCGTLSSYHLSGANRAEIVEVRSQDCDYEGEPVVDPRAWPVVYSRD